jgi:methyl-accepting chemotaxis protein
MILVVFLSAVFLPVMITLWKAEPTLMDHSAAADQFLTLHKRVWLPVSLVFLLFVLHSIAVVHRIAGPLYRIGQVMKTAGEGDLTIRATIRKTDYLHAEADTVNEFLETLESRIDGIKKNIGEVSVAASELRRDGDGSGTNAQILNRLDTALAAVVDGLNQVSGDPTPKEPPDDAQIDAPQKPDARSTTMS